MEIWKLIVTSNLFNFSIFMLVIIFLAKKFELYKIPESMRNAVEKRITEAQQIKDTGLSKLKEAGASYMSLKSEVREIMDEAEKTGQMYSERINTETENKLALLKENIKKLIGAEEKVISSKILSTFAQKSVRHAQKLIEDELVKNPNLHEKFINESLEEISEVAL